MVQAATAATPVSRTQKPGEVGGADEKYNRPQVDDIGEISSPWKRASTTTTTYIGATNNFSSTIALSQVPAFAVTSTW